MDASIDPEMDVLYYPGHLYQRKNGDIWVSQPGGRISVIRDGEITEHVTQSYSPDDPAVGAFFTELNDSTFWVAASDGRLYVVDDIDHNLVLALELTGINDLKSRDNELWIAGDHVYRIELSEDNQRIIDQETFRLNLGKVNSLALDSRGNIYMGIEEKGLYYLDRRSGREARYIKIFSSNDPHRVNELPFKNIHNIVMESDDELWICSAEGLGILQRRFFESLGSIPNANTTSICIAENGKIFINFGDIYVLEPTDFGYEGKPLPSFAREPVTALTAFRDRLWAGTSTGNLYELDHSGKIQRSVDLKPRGEGIYYITCDSQDRLWVCQAPEELPIVGIGCILPNGSLKEYGYERGFQSRALCLKETSHGRIYASAIGKESYLYRYLPEEDGFVNLSLPLDFDVSPNFEVHDLAIAEDGIIWLASTNGLLRYDMDRVRQVDLGPEYTDMEYRAVSDMPDGSIWISTDTEGVIRYKEGEPVVIKEESGLPSKVMTYRCLTKDKNNRLWVGTAEGAVYSLEENPTPRRSNEPLLLNASIDGIGIPVGKISLFQDQKLILKYVAPAFHGFKTFYQHRINSEFWSVPSTRSTWVIENKEPGRHTIEIRSRDEGGYQWSDPISAHILVRERWYNLQLVRWVPVVILATLLFWLLFYRKRKYTQYIAKLNRVVQKEKEEVVKKDADLIKVKEEIHFEQRQLRVHLLSIEIMHRLISKITPGMKWDVILEIISIDLLKLPGIIAFEIGTRQGSFIDFEGYSERADRFTSARIPYDPGVNLSAHCIEGAKPMIFKDIEYEAMQLFSEWDQRLDQYKSGISVPFYLEKKHALLSIYSDVGDLFDEYSLKAMAVFATYLEQIH